MLEVYPPPVGLPDFSGQASPAKANEFPLSKLPRTERTDRKAPGDPHP